MFVGREINMVFNIGSKWCDFFWELFWFLNDWYVGKSRSLLLAFNLGLPSFFYNQYLKCVWNEELETNIYRKHLENLQKST